MLSRWWWRRGRCARRPSRDARTPWCWSQRALLVGRSVRFRHAYAGLGRRRRSLLLVDARRGKRIRRRCVIICRGNRGCIDGRHVSRGKSGRCDGRLCHLLDVIAGEETLLTSTAICMHHSASPPRWIGFFYNFDDVILLEIELVLFGARVRPDGFTLRQTRGRRWNGRWLASYDC